MSTTLISQAISVQDYLSGEQSARHRHEYVNGDVYAMVGATNTHNRISTNAAGFLYAQLRGKPCQIFNSDTKIRFRKHNDVRFYYPDASVVCRPNSPGDTFHDEPVVVIEVVSPSTRRTDEQEKRDAYLSIDSLRVYVLAEQSAVSVVVHRRTADGWITERYAGLDAVIPLPEIDCQLPLADLYEKVEFPPQQVREDGESEW